MNKIVSKQEWNELRAELLLKEKAMTKQRDALTADIRAMPWRGQESAGDPASDARQ